MRFHKLTAVCCMFAAGLIAATATNAQSFTGFYVGGNGGALLGRYSSDTSTVFSNTGYFASTSVTDIAVVGAQKVPSTNFVGGGQGGFNLQLHGLVVGVEGEFGYLGLNESKTSGDTYPCCAPTSYSIVQTVKSDWNLGVRPRVGLVKMHTLIYGTGGLAVTNLNENEVFTDTFASALETGSAKKNVMGWSAGGGLEFHFAKHLSARGEFLFNDFGKVTATSTNLNAEGETWPTNVFTQVAHAKAQFVRVGVNYWF
jgi:outer membrane immunogenic protein